MASESDGELNRKRSLRHSRVVVAAPSYSVTHMFELHVSASQVVLILLLTVPCVAFIPCLIPDCFQVCCALFWKNSEFKKT